ncbi:CMRF35-like molecule 8 [Carassius gibelio]|uniref:CMRF35-like molecule 8 n=1 Tax=Carassius gibelio TaxID=101364 RepID=UPI0022796437|nr:CMRF35-like molecule 8 [Carassius gibelio]
MAAHTKTKIFYISVGFWLILGVECYDGWSNQVLTVQTGGSVTIPCYYDKKYTQQKKYWFLDIDMKYTNISEENLSVIDHPDQSLFTVTMRNLQDEDTGGYHCVVDIEGIMSSTYEVYIQVQSAPDVSVVSSSVSGHEGGDISVQCLYSSGYQNEVKQWCTSEFKHFSMTFLRIIFVEWIFVCILCSWTISSVSLTFFYNNNFFVAFMIFLFCLF